MIDGQPKTGPWAQADEQMKGQKGDRGYFYLISSLSWASIPGQAGDTFRSRPAHVLPPILFVSSSFFSHF